MTRRRWYEFVKGTDEGDIHDEQRANAQIKGQVLDAYFSESERALGWLADSESEIDPEQRTILMRRWMQIQNIINEASRKHH